jgi:hypothetical protein
VLVHDTEASVTKRHLNIKKFIDMFTHRLHGIKKLPV